MALHGPICVNGEKIGAWYARRTVRNPEPHTLVCYEGEVHLGQQVWKGNVHHYPEEGAVALMITLLLAASATVTPAHEPT